LAIEVIPNLGTVTFSHGDTPWMQFGDHWIPKLFEMSFQFRDGANRWGSKFEIGMSDDGTPTLLQVAILGRINPSTDKVIREVSDDEDALEGVQRWQLKVIEKYQFQLLAMSVEFALHRSPPNPKEGEPHSDGVGDSVILSEIELQKLYKKIGEKVRQRVSYDFLLEVADIYTSAGNRNENPIMAIVEQKKCSHRRAQQYAAMAREKELLPQTSPGKVTVKPLKRLKGNPTWQIKKEGK
jgi:hypothetical protein